MNWIKSAIKKPGALHRSLGVPLGQAIPEEEIDEAARSSGVIGRRARLAKTLKGLNKDHIRKVITK